METVRFRQKKLMVADPNDELRNLDFLFAVMF